MPRRNQRISGLTSSGCSTREGVRARLYRQACLGQRGDDGQGVFDGDLVPVALKHRYGDGDAGQDVQRDLA